MRLLKMRSGQWLVGIVTAGLGLLLSLQLALAAGEQLSRSVVSSGGGTVNQGSLTLLTTIGQPTAGGATASNGQNLCSGFLCGPGVPDSSEPGLDHSIYLPLLRK
jgi:hypothetical protein